MGRKICTICNESLSLDQFHKDNKNKDGRCNKCKTCKTAKSLKHYHENKDQLRAYRSSYRAVNKSKQAIYSRNWSINNRDKRNESGARRRIVTSNKVNYEAIRVRDNNICYLCEDAITDDLHFDHVIPLSRGGTHTEDNIKVTHAKCNLSKSNKLISELGVNVHG